jgi:hypothetical protein
MLVNGGIAVETVVSKRVVSVLEVDVAVWGIVVTNSVNLDFSVVIAVEVIVSDDDVVRVVIDLVDLDVFVTVLLGIVAEVDVCVAEVLVAVTVVDVSVIDVCVTVVLVAVTVVSVFLVETNSGAVLDAVCATISFVRVPIVVAVVAVVSQLWCLVNPV